MTIELGGPAPRVDVRGGPGCLAATVSGRGAAALVVDRADVRMVAVWEPLRAEPAPALRARLAAALQQTSPAEVVAQCRDEGTSVVVAQVRAGGEMQLVGWAAPSVLHVRRDRPGLTTLPVPAVA